MISLYLLCGGFAAYAETPDSKSTPGVFTNPQLVTIKDYSQDAMEPFISPDGNYLFFNDSNNPPPGSDTKLFYATRIDDLAFQFQGEIGGVNSMGPLNAVASMDVNNTFYFVSNRSYAQTLSTIYSGTFSNNSVSNIALVQGISKEKAGDVNFDACISPDGNTLYFDDGVYNGGQLLSANIEIAMRKGGQFVRLKKSAKIMREINTHGLNYAPDISKSGLEFFFTRFDGTAFAIYTATRANTSKPFGKPVKIEAISGFVEAPALSPDEKSLYYHRQENGVFVIYRVTRP